VSNSTESAPWTLLHSRLLRRERIRALAIILAGCLWGVCVLDYATPGIFDRAGNIKFQDFLPLYVSSRLIAQGHADQLYDPPVIAGAIQAVVGRRPQLRLPYLYGPQVGLLFVPLAKLSFPAAARIWVSVSVLVYFICIYAVWNCCTSLRLYREMVLLAAVAFPPLFAFLLRGQTSALALACFTAAFLALKKEHRGLSGFALGFLFFKPQFLVAIPLLLLLAHAWKILAGVVLSAGAQLAFTRLYFGPTVVHAYLDMLRHSSRWTDIAELSLAPIQMHSLRSFFSLLIPSPAIAFTPYVLSSICVAWLASRVWQSESAVSVRFPALILAAVLINPHLFVYDLLVLAPAFLLLTDWSLENPHHPAKPSLDVLLYLAFLLPLFGPLAHWTHLQLSVIVFAALLWTLRRLQISEVPIPSR
jgi:glycosyl transferase family 87